MPYEIEINEGPLGVGDAFTTLVGDTCQMNGVEYRLVSANVDGTLLYRRTDGVDE